MSANFEKLKELIHQTVIERLNNLKRQKQIRKIMNSKINKRLSESKLKSHISDKIMKRLDSFKYKMETEVNQPDEIDYDSLFQKKKSKNYDGVLIESPVKQLKPNRLKDNSKKKTRHKEIKNSYL